MKKVRMMVKTGTSISLHGNTGQYRDRPQYIAAYSFWGVFFEQNCAQPNDEKLLFPVNESLQHIYDTYFKKWHEKQLFTLQRDNDIPVDELPWIPSFTTFVRARWDPDFESVTVRPRHYHSICKLCADLRKRKLQGFFDDDHKAVYQKMFELHERDKLGWRKIEGKREAEVRAPNSESVLLAYDDTSTIGCPRFGNRDIKNGPIARFQLVPFNICNYASGENAYVYTVQGRYLKGGNRLCTVLYHYLRKIKWGSDDCRHATTLYLHADNYSENKNNCIFCFCSELVLRGWFDKIIMEFGPVGHTHNGRDAVHHIHNRIAGNYYSMTIGEFQRTWQHSWRKDGTMPAAVVADVQYDWWGRYFPKGRKTENRVLQGFTNTQNDHKSVLAFKFEKGPTSDVEVHWKQHHHTKWLGVNAEPNSTGYVLLHQVPVGDPVVIPPKDTVMDSDSIKQLVGPSMQAIVEPYMNQSSPEATRRELDETMEWLWACATTGQIPFDVVSTSSDQATPLPSQWGRPVKIGVTGKQGDFFLMEPDPSDSDYGFWHTGKNHMDKT